MNGLSSLFIIKSQLRNHKLRSFTDLVEIISYALCHSNIKKISGIIKRKENPDIINKVIKPKNIIVVNRIENSIELLITCLFSLHLS